MNTNSSLTIGEWLSSTTKTLSAAGIGSARLDALILLEDNLQKDRAWILANHQHKVNPKQASELGRLIKRRVKHEPLSYIRGYCEFYGRRFLVDSRVLEPRAESETMIEHLLKLELPREPRIADIGSGSGALGITAKLEVPSSKIDLIDIDEATLKVATKNAELLKADVKLHKGNLLSGDHGPYDVLLTNLPYVPDDWHINEAASKEPRIAIFGGQDGLDLYRQLFDQVTSNNWQPEWILCESLPPQHRALSKIAKSHGFELHTTSDFIQVYKKRT